MNGERVEKVQHKNIYLKEWLKNITYGLFQNTRETIKVISSKCSRLVKQERGNNIKNMTWVLTSDPHKKVVETRLYRSRASRFWI